MMYHNIELSTQLLKDTFFPAFFVFGGNYESSSVILSGYLIFFY